MGEVFLHTAIEYLHSDRTVDAARSVGRLQWRRVLRRRLVRSALAADGGVSCVLFFFLFIIAEIHHSNETISDDHKGKCSSQQQGLVSIAPTKLKTVSSYLF